MQITPFIIAIGTIVPPVVEKIKDSDLFPWITAEDKTRLVAVSAVLSSLAAVVAGLGTGAIETNSWVGLVEALVNALAAFGLAELAYRHIFKRFQVPAVKPEQPVDEQTT